MTVQKLVVVGLVSVIAGQWIWMLSTAENSISNLGEPAQIAAQELGTKTTSAGFEQRIDPLSEFAPR